METEVQVPAGVEGDFHQDCRECRAGYYQAQRSQLAFLCLEHGTIEYDPTIARDALLAACEAAHTRLLENDSRWWEDAHDEIVAQLEAAIQLARENRG